MTKKEDLDSPATKRDLLALKKEMVHQFRLIAENLHHDYLGAFGDRTSQLQDKTTDHEVRIGRIEKRLQMV